MDPILLALAFTLQKDILLPEILLKDVSFMPAHFQAADSQANWQPWAAHFGKCGGKNSVWLAN